MKELERREMALRGLHRMKAELSPTHKTRMIDKMITIAEQRIQEFKQKLANEESREQE